jgi:hypothetical protein
MLDDLNDKKNKKLQVSFCWNSLVYKTPHRHTGTRAAFCFLRP